MGRWAQNRRRGGDAPAPATPPPPADPSIVQVLIEPSFDGYRLQFDLPVVSNASTPDGAFTINGSPVSTAFNTGPTEISGGMPNVGGDTVSWDCTGQPNFITTVIQQPASGTTAPA